MGDNVCCAELLSHVQLFATPWTAASPALLSMAILQARILKWVAMPFFRGSSQPRDKTQAFCTAGGFFTNWATREAQEKLRDWPKKAEQERTDVFKLCCWRRLLRVPWTARRLSQSILKEINPTYSLEGQEYSGHLLGRADSLEKTLMLGKIKDRRRRGWQRIRWLYDITDSTDMSFSKLQEIVKNREAWCAAVHGVAQNWTLCSD